MRWNFLRNGMRSTSQVHDDNPRGEKLVKGPNGIHKQWNRRGI
jgi:hypothetical protein